MKTINVTFDNEEMLTLENAKGDLTWREFILTLVSSKNKYLDEYSNSTEV